MENEEDNTLVSFRTGRTSPAVKNICYENTYLLELNHTEVRECKRLQVTRLEFLISDLT